MKPFPLFAALLVAGTLLTGCGGGSNDTVAPIADAPVTTRSQYGPLEFTLTVPKTVHRLGEKVPMTFTVTNTSSNPVRAVYGISNYYLRVTQGDKTFLNGTGGGIGVVLEDMFAPGETKTLDASWFQNNNTGQNVAKGVYTVYVQYNSHQIYEDTKDVLRPSDTEFVNQLSPPPVEVTIQ